MGNGMDPSANAHDHRAWFLSAAAQPSRVPTHLLLSELSFKVRLRDARGNGARGPTIEAHTEEEGHRVAKGTFFRFSKFLELYQSIFDDFLL